MTPSVDIKRDKKCYPLSFAQERLWLLQQIDPHCLAYNVPLGIRLIGALNVTALEAALSDLVRRHDVLRSVVLQRAGTPFQAILPAGDIRLEIVDVSSDESAEWKTVLGKLATQEGREPFNLSKGPLFRCKLLRASEQEHVLVITMHHIVTDGWSLDIVRDELERLYEAYSNGDPPDLATLPLHYGDFAAWQRNKLPDAGFESSMAYWEQRLLDAPRRLELPTDHARPSGQSYQGLRRSILLESGLISALKNIGQQSSATLFMSLFGAFAVLIARYTRNDDIVIGSPIAGRTRVEIERVVGFFVNLIALRMDLTGNPSFRELLDRVRETAIEAYAHQEAPFEKVVHKVVSERALNFAPVFQIVFQLKNFPHLKNGGSTLLFSEFEVETGAAQYDLAFDLAITPAGVACRCDFATDLFEPSTIERMLGHYRKLLQEIVIHPDRPIGELPLLTGAERHQLLVEWNDTAVEYPGEQCVHELFEQQVERTPDAVAVIFEDQELTYRELNARANQLAHHLRNLGVGPETLVGLCLQRSPELVVGILGILKAGGAYLPLDPEYPQQRLQFMLADAKVRFLVTQQRLLDCLPVTDYKVVCVDTDAANLQDLSRSNPSVNVAADNVAYVMFTSGSTGRPKGVAIRHTSIARLVLGSDYATFGPDRVFLQLATVSFDASTFELWGALLHGAKLVIAPAGLPDNRQLEDLLKQHRVTTLWLTSTLLNQVVQHYPQVLNSVDEILTGGEALSVPHIAKAQAALGSRVQLINGYGPTENTTFTTCYRIPSHISPELESIPIGRPIANTQVYVLDKRRHPVPIGVPGELYIGGAGLARGYLNRPELTAERFVANPFDNDPTSRLYCTGDLCRWLPDGNLEFLGRLDHQVKIRGFRIELGEIETVLAGHPQLREVVALAREDEPGEKRLVAYVVAEAVPTPTVGALRTFLSQKLPEYMVPSAFVFLDQLPRTPNGKLDRKALPGPDDQHRQPATDYAAPYTPLQKVLTELWAEVLNLECVGIDDNFFDLGGHSLLATRLIWRMRRELEVDLPLKAIFDTPTIRKLAVTMEDRQEKASQRRRSVMQHGYSSQVDRQGLPNLAPVSFGQQRFWFIEQLQPGSTTYDVQPVLVIEGDLDVPALERALGWLVLRHEVLRTVLVTVDGEPYQKILPAGAVSLDQVDLTHHPADVRAAELERLIHEEHRTGFDLQRGPLWRSRLIRMEPQRTVWLLSMSHVVVDHWSLRIFFRELGECYSAEKEGREPNLAPLPARYVDYAVWQRQRMQEAEAEQQLTYWTRKLSDIPALLKLPTDFSRPAEQSGRGARRRYRLPEKIVATLQTFGRHHQVSRFMILLTVFKCLLFRLSGQPTIVVGTPLANRGSADYENVIGMFLNTSALRTDIAADMTFLDVLAQVREAVFEAFQHQELPFEQLVDHLRPPRNLSHAPIFQVLFTEMVASEVRPRLTGTRVTFVPQDPGVSKFDLSLFARAFAHEIELLTEFDTALFKPETIDRFHQQFEAMLADVLDEPSRSVGELSVFSENMRQTATTIQADLTTPFRPDVLHRMVQRQAATTPERTALVCGTEQLCFAELDRRSNQIANHLIQLGVAPGYRVAVCLPRRAELYVSLLAVLKAGAVCVPFDPEHPRARLSLMFDNAQPEAAIVCEDSKHVLCNAPRVVVDIDRDAAAISAAELGSPVVDVAPEHLAYILYTSGSTGIPKGVAMPHGPIANLIAWQKESSVLPASAPTAQFAPVTFDVSFQEIFFCFSSGAPLIVVGEEERRDPTALMAFIAEQGVQRVFLPFVALNSLAEAAAEAGLFSANLRVREVITAGEQPIMTDAIRRFFGGLPGCVLHNQYGPTEAHVVTCHTMTGDPQAWPYRPPLGRPIAGARIYVLDDHGKLCPPQVTGELVIGGSCLARGYYGQPQWTAERFADDPFADDPTSRMYHTGDLARADLDGVLEYRGRIDKQIKYRGYRIELGEIEAVLVQHPSVQLAAVVLQGSTTDEGRLLGYVVPASGFVADEVLEYLREKLPNYMVPSTIVTVESLPLTTTGKIDRESLLALEPSPSSSSITPEAQRAADYIERQIIDWCQELLGVEHVRRQDDFFELGGHSLLAARLFARIKAHFHVEVPLSLLFADATIAGLAAAIRERDSKFSNIVSFEAHGARRPLFVLPSMSGDVLMYRKLAQRLAPDQPVFGVRPGGEQENLRSYESFEEFVSRCLEAIRHVEPHGPYRLVGYSFAGMVAYEAARMLREGGEHVELLAMVDAGFVQRPKSARDWLCATPRLLANLPLWIYEDILRTPPAHVFKRIALKLRFWRLQRSRTKTVSMELNRWLDMSRLPEQYRAIIEANFAAFLKYQPQNYAGDLTLFRARARPLLDGSSRDLGWSHYVTGKVDIKIIPGHHANLLQEPNVEVLAEKLLALLKALDNSAVTDGRP